MTEYLLFALCALLALTPLITWLLVSHRVSGSVSFAAKLEERGALVEARRVAEELRRKFDDKTDPHVEARK